MKVLMINKYLYTVGGCENYMFFLSEKLEKEGHEVQFFGLRSTKNVVGNEYNIYVTSFEDKRIANPFSLIYNQSAKNKLIKLLRLYKPDIVHLNNIYYHLTTSIIDACKKEKIPVVMTVHDSQLICPNHMLYRFKEDVVCEECVKAKKDFKPCLKYRCHKDSLLKSYLVTLEGRMTHSKRKYDYVSKFICPSLFLKSKLVNGGYDESKLVVKHNFLLSAKQKTIPNKEDYVLFFGRLSEEKGISLLLKAMPKNIHLIIAGTGPLENYVKEHLEQNMEYVGYKSGAELKDLIAKAKFTIYPSKWYENCPLSVIESIYYCSPVIAAGMGGNLELIDNCVTGLFYENNNSLDLSEKISYLYNNEVLLKEMYNNCLSYNKTPTIDEYYDMIISLYKEIID